MHIDLWLNINETFAEPDMCSTRVRIHSKKEHIIRGTSAIIPSSCKVKWLLLLSATGSITPESWGLPGDESAGSLQPLTLPDSLCNPPSTHQALICAAQWTSEHSAWRNRLLQVSTGHEKNMMKTHFELVGKKKDPPRSRFKYEVVLISQV